MKANNRFDVENALSLYASRYVQLPAHQLYDADILGTYEKPLKNCHVYVIGKLPAVKFENVRQIGKTVRVGYVAGGIEGHLELPCPPELKLIDDGEYFFFQRSDGAKFVPDMEKIFSDVIRATGSGFEVLYIGQAYGKAGARNAVDRLLKHETLQRISLRERDPNFGLHVV